MSTRFPGARVMRGRPGLPGTGVSAGQLNSILSDISDLQGLTPPQELSDLDDADTSGATTGDLLRYDGSDWVPHTPTAITIPHSLNYTIDGGGSTITTGLKYGFQVNHGGTITGWEMGGNQSGTASIAVWKDASANYPPTVGDLILTMTITGAVRNSASGLSIPFSAGDWFFFNVGTMSSFQFLAIALKATRQVGP